jgi:UDP-N-acetylmuramyl pentapeptide phosphotransferase/UDP-N-acetylglucosamine-1-phosphate transferase
MPQLMQKRRTPAAGGIFLFLGPVIGSLYGIGRGEPILWMLIGFGAGMLLAILIWVADRWRG